MTRRQQYVTARYAAIVTAVALVAGAYAFLEPFADFIMCMTGSDHGSVCYVNLSEHEAWSDLTPAGLLTTLMAALAGIRLAQDAWLLKLRADGIEPEILTQMSLHRIVANLMSYHLGLIAAIYASMLAVYTLMSNVTVSGLGPVVWLQIAGVGGYAAYRSRPIVRALNDWHV